MNQKTTKKQLKIGKNISMSNAFTSAFVSIHQPLSFSPFFGQQKNSCKILQRKILQETIIIWISKLIEQITIWDTRKNRTTVTTAEWFMFESEKITWYNAVRMSNANIVLSLLRIGMKRILMHSIISASKSTNIYYMFFSLIVKHKKKSLIQILMRKLTKIILVKCTWER